MRGLIALVILAIVSLTHSPLRIEPKDEGARDPSFVAFRAELRSVAEACNEEGLWRAFAEDVAGPEGRRGLGETRAYFEREQREENASSLPVCQELARALALGTHEWNGRYCAPYALCVFPDPDLWGNESEGTGVAMGSRVIVRSRPGADAHPVDTLSYEVVEVCRTSTRRGLCERVPDQAPGWYAVVSPRGGVGYVRTDDVLIPNGNLQFAFARRPEGWRLVGVGAWE